MSVSGPTRGGVPRRWRDRHTGEELVAVAVEPFEEGCMVLPIKPGRAVHPLDWQCEGSFLRSFEEIS